MRVATLAGGVGGSKLVLGLYHVMRPEDLTVIANTGDDMVLHGLHISPDPDIVIYTLADVVNPETGWGFRGETWRTMEGLTRYGRPAWFNLGDRDLATHIHRTAMLKDGATLSEALESIRTALGVRARILPMTDSPAATFIDTAQGRMHLQDYFVRLKCEPVVKGVVLTAAERTEPAPGVIAAILSADAIILSPSNPLISIGPILAVQGVRDALRERRTNVATICPLVGGRSLKGPSDKMMAELGYEVSAAGVARLYRDFCTTMIIDTVDADQSSALEELGVRPVVRPTVMRTLQDKEQLARDVLSLFR